MTTASLRIAGTVDQFYDESAPLAFAGLKYKDAITSLDEEARTTLDKNLKACVLEPIGKLIGTFPEINDLIKKRYKKSLDHDAHRSKVRKLVESPSNDPSKLPRAESDANASKEVYEALNRQLATEIPKVTHGHHTLILSGLGKISME